MKNQPKFENTLKTLTFFTSILILLPFFTIFIFCPEILGLERHNLYISNTKIFESLKWPRKNILIISKSRFKVIEKNTPTLKLKVTNNGLSDQYYN